MSLAVDLNGIDIPLSEMGAEFSTILKEFDHKEEFLINLALDYKCNVEKNEFKLKEISIGASDLGEIEVSLGLGNVNLDLEEIANLITTYQQITLLNAKISYIDDSLFEKAIKLTAQNENQTVEELKREIIEELDKEISEEKDKFVKNGLGEIKEFINKPQKLSISASPANRLSFSRMSQVDEPKEFIKLLGLKIKS